MPLPGARKQSSICLVPDVVTTLLCPRHAEPQGTQVGSRKLNMKEAISALNPYQWMKEVGTEPKRLYKVAWERETGVETAPQRTRDRQCKNLKNVEPIFRSAGCPTEVSPKKATRIRKKKILMNTAQ